MNFHPSGRRTSVLAVLAVLLLAIFAARGTWQLVRLEWKQDLIAHVEQRVYRPPVDAPPEQQWDRINARDYESLRVRVQGLYLPELATRVRASTELGAGYWLLEPMKTAGVGC